MAVVSHGVNAQTAIRKRQTLESPTGNAKALGYLFSELFDLKPTRAIELSMRQSRWIVLSSRRCRSLPGARMFFERENPGGRAASRNALTTTRSTSCRLFPGLILA